MSELQVEENLNKARSLLIKGKELEATDLLKSIIKNFPQNKKVQSVIQQLKQSSVKQLNPSQEKINTLFNLFSAIVFIISFYNQPNAVRKFISPLLKPV